MHIVIYGQMAGQPLVQLTVARGESAAELNRDMARALREQAARFERTAERLDGAAKRLGLDVSEASGDRRFDEIAARLRAEGMGDGTAG